MKKTVLIFGASSFVGSNIAESLSADYRVIGTYHNHRVVIPNVLTVPCDVLNRDQVQLLIYAFRPDIVVYAIGVSSVIAAHESRDIAHSLNTVGVFNVTSFSERFRAKFCYISSAMIFAGNDVVYNEGDTPLPDTVYGTTMASAEFYIQKSCLNYLVLRSCNLYGRGINPFGKTWFELMEDKLFKNEASSYDNKVNTGFLDIAYLADILKLCLKADITNRLIQVSSSDFCTRYEFAMKYAEVFGFSQDLISPGKWFFPIDELSAKDYGKSSDVFHYRLSIENLEHLIRARMPRVEDSLLRTYKRFGGKSKKNRGQNAAIGIKYI